MTHTDQPPPFHDTLPFGTDATFTYRHHSTESSARLALRNGQTVTVLDLRPNYAAEPGSTLAQRTDAATPITYTVRFPDGHTDGAFEDELTPLPPSVDGRAALIDLRDRIRRAEANLTSLHDTMRIAAAPQPELSRITGKAEGVRLALSYVEEALR